MSLNKLKNVALGVAVLTLGIAGSIESAEAGFARGTGRATNGGPGPFDFVLEIDTSVKNSQADLKEGIFPRAFRFSANSESGDFPIYEEGDLKSSLIGENSVLFTGGNELFEFTFSTPFSNPNSLYDLSQFLNEKKEVTSGIVQIWSSRQQVVSFAGGITFTFEDDPKKVPESSTIFGIFTLLSLASASQLKQLNRKNSHLPCTSSKQSEC
jgi:hypothetical protein